MLFERAGGGRDAHKGNWNGGHVLGMAVVVGLSAALCQREEQREANAVAAVVRADLDVLLALASLHRRSWRRLFCRRLCGRRGDCDGGGRDGLSAALQQREKQREANAVAVAVRTDSAVLLALASLHRRSWRRLFCRRLCGRRGDCDVGGWAVGVVAAAGGAAGSNTVAAGVPGSAYRAQARKKTCPRRQEQRQWQQQLASKTT